MRSNVLPIKLSSWAPALVPGNHVFAHCRMKRRGGLIREQAPAMTANVDGHSSNPFGFFRLEIFSKLGPAGVAHRRRNPPPIWATGFSPIVLARFSPPAPEAHGAGPGEGRWNFFVDLDKNGASHRDSPDRSRTQHAAGCKEINPAGGIRAVALSISRDRGYRTITTSFRFAQPWMASAAHTPSSVSILGIGLRFDQGL